MNYEILTNLEKNTDPAKNYCFDVSLSDFVPKWIFAPTSIFVRAPILIEFHLDGQMYGSILTLVSGIKKWRIISPYKKELYYTTQVAGETIFVPPRFLHKVETTNNFSITYGSMWEISEKQQFKLIRV
jgi:hypothetical protein